MLNLEELKFKIDTTELKTAVELIDKLGVSAGGLTKPVKQAEDSTSRFDALLEKMNNRYKDMSNGFTKGESSILNQARAMGAVGEQLKPLIDLMEKIKDLSKDPFDSSLGSLRSIKGELEAIKLRASLAAEEVFLTNKQLKEFSKIKAETEGKLIASGVDVKSAEGQRQLNELVKQGQTEYLGLVKQVNSLEAAEQLRNKQLQETLKLEAEQMALMQRLNSQKSKEFWNEYSNAIGQTSPEIAKLNAYFKEQSVVAAQLAAVENDLIESEKKLAFQAEQMNRGFTSASANALYNYKTALESLGLSANETRQRLYLFEQGLMARQGTSPFAKMQKDVEATTSSMKGMSRQVDHLSRAIGVQLGDVFVSLASGQNPLTVLIQQGDQLRFAVANAKDAGQDLDKAMKNALAGITMSFVDTAKVIGGFFLESFKSAISSVISSVKGLYSVFSDGINYITMTGTASEKAAAGQALLASITDRLRLSLAFLGKVGIAAVILALTSLTIGTYQSMKASDELAQTLVKTGGALGISHSSALVYAESLRSVGLTSSDATKWIAEVAKQGNLTSIEMLNGAETAKELSKWLGISFEDTAKLYSKLKEKPTEGLIEVAKATGLIPPEIIKTVAEFERLGEKQKAIEIAMKSVADANKTQIATMKQDYTSFAKTMIELGSSISKWWDNLFVGVWTKADPTAVLSKKIKDLKDQVESIQQQNRAANIADDPETMKHLNDQLRMAQSSLSAMVRQNAERDRTVALNSQIASQQGDLEQTITNLMKEQSNLDATKVSQAEYVAKMTERELKGYSKLVDTSKARLLLEQKFSKEWEDRQKKEATSGAMKKDTFYNPYNADLVHPQLQYEKDYNEALLLREKLLGKAEDKGKEYYATLERIQYLQEQGMFTEGEANHMVDLLDKGTKAYKDQQRAIAESTNELEKYKQGLFGLEDAYVLMQIEAEYMQSTNEERKRGIALRKIELDYAKELRDIYSNDKMSSGDKELAAEAARGKRLQAEKNLNQEIANDAAQKYLEEFNRIRDSLSDAIVTSLIDGAEAGKKKLKDIITAELRKPITLVVNAIVSAAMGSVSDSLNSSSSPLSDITSFSNAVSSALTNSMSTQFNKLAFSSFGEKIGLVEQGAGNMQLSPFGSAAKTTLNYAGNALGGYAAYDAISGGYSTGLPKGLTNTAVVIASAINPVLGAVAGLINRAFGKKLSGSGISGSFGENGEFDGKQFTDYKGGWFKSDSTKFAELSSGVTEGLSQTFKLMKLEVAGLSDAMGLGTESVAEFTADFKVNLLGLSQEDATKAINTEMQKILENMAEVALGTKEYNRQGETSYETLTRLSSVLSYTNAVFDSLGWELNDVSLAGAVASQAFVDLFGGLDKATAALNTYYENFYTEAEKSQFLTENLTESLNALGFELPQTREGFRALVDAAEDAGNDTLVANLLKLQYAFIELVPATAAASSALGSLQSSFSAMNSLSSTLLRYGDSSASQDMLSILQGSYKFITDLNGKVTVLGEISDLESNINSSTTSTSQIRLEAIKKELENAKELLRAGKELKSYIQSLKTSELSTLNPEQQLQAAAQVYRETLEKAKRGDAEAAGALQENANTYLQQAQSFYGSNSAYASVFSEVTSSIDDLSSKLIKKNDPLVNRLDKQVTALENQLEVSQNIFNQTKSLYNTAVEQFNQSLNTAAAEAVANDKIASALTNLPAALAGVLSSTIKSSLSTLIPKSSGTSDTAYDSLLTKVSQGTVSIQAAQQYSMLSSTASALALSSNPVAQGLAAALQASSSTLIRGYATGGSYPGGLAMVGEEGPELINFNRPGQVYNNAQTQKILQSSGTSDEETKELLRALVVEVKALRNQQGSENSTQVTKLSSIERKLSSIESTGILEKSK